MPASSVEIDWRLTAEELAIPDFAMDILRGAMDALTRHHRPTAEHSMRVGMLAVRIGRHHRKPLDLKPLFYGGSLHDLGKLDVDPSLLNKTGEWTEADAAALLDHPVAGYEALRELMPVTASLVIRHHTFQSHSYPSALPPHPEHIGEEFHDWARVVALADHYDASHRPQADGSFDDGETIREKMLANNPDVSDLVSHLYDRQIFNPDHALAS